MSSSTLSLFLSLSILFIISAQCLEIKGVPPEKEHLYHQDTLTCDGGQKILKKEWINDEYCDCLDGFDEPSTSACINSHFYCKNEGYTPTTIPSQWVNDNVCDCCDGSDEAEGLCKNTCKNQIKEEYMELQKEAEKYKEALDKKAKYIKKAKDAEAKYESKTTLENELKDYEQEIVAMQEKVNALKTRYDAKIEELLQNKGKKQDKDQSGRDEKKFKKELRRKAENHPEAKDLFIELKSLESELERLKSKKKHIQQDLRAIDVIHYIDFGKDKAYFGMYGKTLSSKGGSFEYQLYPFDKAKQGSVTIGRWDRWDNGNMIYNFGEPCPNGIVRSCTVSVVCGKKTEILSVTEPSQCKYAMNVRTPAACDEEYYESLLKKMEEKKKAFEE